MITIGNKSKAIYKYENHQISIEIGVIKYGRQNHRREDNFKTQKSVFS